MHKVNKNLADVSYILDNLRKEDLEELQALWGENWREETLNNIMNMDFEVLLGKTKKGEVPVVMGGIWEVGRGVGCAWLLSTPEIKNHRHCFLRELRYEIEKSKSKFCLIYNFIYKENFEAKRWLKWLGFRFDNPHPKGVEVPNNCEFFYKVN